MLIFVLSLDKSDCILFIFFFIINFNKFALFFLLFFLFECEVSIIDLIFIYAWVIAAFAILRSDSVAFTEQLFTFNFSCSTLGSAAITWWVRIANSHGGFFLLLDNRKFIAISWSLVLIIVRYLITHHGDIFSKVGWILEIEVAIPQIFTL